MSASELQAAIAQARKADQDIRAENEEFEVVPMNSHTRWSSLFQHYFLELHHEGDDLLFFVPSLPAEPSELHIYRRQSTTRPVPAIGCAEYLWGETLSLNFLLQYCTYQLVVAVCSRAPGVKKLTIAKRFDQRVYASPSRRRMDVKGSQDEMTYPNMFFTIDNFDDSFEQVIISKDQSVCVELVVQLGHVRSSIFSGAVTHAALAAAYSANRASRHLTGVGLKSQHRRPLKFLEMKGPKGVGDAEMAVGIALGTPGSSPSTPTASSASSSSSSASAFTPTTSALGAITKTGSILKKFSANAVTYVKSALHASQADPMEADLNAFATFVSLPMETILESIFERPIKPVFPDPTSKSRSLSTATSTSSFASAPEPSSATTLMADHPPSISGASSSSS